MKLRIQINHTASKGVEQSGTFAKHPAWKPVFLSLLTGFSLLLISCGGAESMGQKMARLKCERMLTGYKMYAEPLIREHKIRYDKLTEDLKKHTKKSTELYSNSIESLRIYDEARREGESSLEACRRLKEYETNRATRDGIRWFETDRKNYRDTLTR